MKDVDLRGIVLMQFYEKRRRGWLGIMVHTMEPIEIPDGVDQMDVLRICEQLGQFDLIEWNGSDDNTGNVCAGVGRITANGVSVIEGEEDSPIAMHIDNSQHNVTVTGGNVGNLQVGGSGNTQTQKVTMTLERVLKVIDASEGSPNDKAAAKSKISEFLEKAAAAVAEGGIRALLDKI